MSSEGLGGDSETSQGWVSDAEGCVGGTALFYFFVPHP